jgi:HK97 gp10 family phage protein
MMERIELKGFDEYLTKVEAAGRDVVQATKHAINESTDYAQKEMVRGAEKHRRTGAVVEAIEAQSAKQDGNFIYGMVGVNTEKHPKAWHAVFQEYGAPTFPADPFIRPALNKNKLRAIQRKALKREGVPIE